MTADLTARLAAATGADRELDALVLCRILAPPGSKVERSSLNGAWCIYAPRTYGPKPFALWDRAPGMFRQDWFRPTASLDAAVALIKPAVGDCSWRVGNTPSGRGFCYLGTSMVEHDGATPPLAILCALFAALDAKAALTASAPQDSPSAPQERAHEPASQAGGSIGRT